MACLDDCQCEPLLVGRAGSSPLAVVRALSSPQNAQSLVGVLQVIIMIL